MELFLLIRECACRDLGSPGSAPYPGLWPGAGLDRVLAARSRFGFSEVRIGFVPRDGAGDPPAHTSEKRAFELLTSATTLALAKLRDLAWSTGFLMMSI